jgi:hypothetical protein
MSPGWSAWISTGIRTAATASAQGTDAHMIHLRCRITNRPWRCISLTSSEVATGCQSRMVSTKGRPPYNPNVSHAPPTKKEPNKKNVSNVEDCTNSLVAPRIIKTPKPMHGYRNHGAILGLSGYSSFMVCPTGRSHREQVLSAIRCTYYNPNFFFHPLF